MKIDGGSNVLRWFVTGTVLLIVFVIFLALKEILLLLLAAVLVALVLDLPIRGLRRLGVARKIGTPIVIGTVIVLIIVINIVTVPTIARQSEVLVTDTIPRSLRQFDSWWRRQNVSIGEALQDVPVVDDMSASQLANGLEVRFDEMMGSIIEGITPFVNGAVSTVFSILVVFFAVIFILAEPHVYMNGILNLVPPFYRERGEDIFFKLDMMLRHWILATGVSMVLLGIGVWIGLQLLGVPQALILSILAGATSFIPNFGPVIAVIPALAVAFATPEVNPLLVVVVIYAMTFLQNQILLPILMANAVNIPPLAILFGQIIFGLLFGFLGLLLAVPLTVIIGVLVNEIYVRDVLGYQPQQLDEDTDEEEIDEKLDAAYSPT